MRPLKPALIVHTFTRSVTGLRPAWSAAAALGMDQPIGRWPVQPGTGHSSSGQAFAVLAGRQQIRPGEFHQAVAYRMHDVYGVSVLLGPNDDRISWEDLTRRWNAALTEPQTDTIGTVAVHAGLLPPARGWRRGRADPVQTARRWERLLPGQWADLWCRTEAGVIAWEQPGDDLTRRRMVVAADDEAALDDWMWGSDRPGLPALTHYLLHAAKLRYQHQVLVKSMPGLRNAVARAERECADLDHLLDDGDPPLTRLIAADRALSAAQTDQGGLITALGDVRDMARSVQVARRNMTAALGATVRSAPGGPLAADQDLADWTREQLRTEEIYLESAHQRVREVARLAGAAIDQRQRQRQEGLTLLQTSVVGALLMTLAAIQSLTYRTPLPAPLLAPVICLLAVIALVLPAALLRRPHRNAPGRQRLAAAGATGLTGAALGWFGATLGWEIWFDRGAPEHVSLWLAGGGFLVLAAVTAAVLFRPRR